MPYLVVGACVVAGALIAAVALPRVRSRNTVPTPAASAESASAWGTVVLPFGRYFAARADLLTREGFKTVLPIDGISPFSAVGVPDPDMQRFAEGDRVNDRVKADVSKDFASRLARSGADYLVVDNTAALLWHRERNGRIYTVVPGEDTDLMDELWGDGKARAHALGFKARASRFKASEEGFSDRLRSAYDAFVAACMESFDPARITLIRSHAARFSVGNDGTVAPTNLNPKAARLLEELDEYFIARTGCQVSNAALDWIPSESNWLAHDHRLRIAIEADLVKLITSRPRPEMSDAEGTVPRRRGRRGVTAADHVLGVARGNHPLDQKLLRDSFTAGGATHDDLLALAFLEQSHPGSHDELVRECVQRAVADAGSYPLAETKRRFDRSLHALRGWEWRTPRLPEENPWTPQITLGGKRAVFRFHSDGSIERFTTSPVGVSDAEAIVDDRLPVTPLNVAEVIGSWPVYFERGRRGITTAPRVVVPHADALVDSCYWLDWSWVLDNERVMIITPDYPGRKAARSPGARTDLSFIFDPNARVCTVGGGLMDQVTHIALFDKICEPLGLDYYLDDFRYTWWRSHNGFEASRLAPDLERKRITRLVSHALVESFRSDVMTTRLPWVFNQSRVWHDFGLREAMVVTRDYRASRRLVEIGPEFPVHVYMEDEELVDLMKTPPKPVSFFTTQHRIPIAAESAAPLRRVFSYHHLETSGLDPDVAATAEKLRSAPHVAFHVRRGDKLNPRLDTGGWYAQQHHYVDAINHLIESEFGTSDFNVAVFSDDLEFVEAHESAYGLDRVSGEVRFIRGNEHFKSIYDSYLMSLCPVIVGSVGFFAATTSLLADAPSVFIRALPYGVHEHWRREG